MKKCLYCAEEIQDEAIKCRHCGEMLTATAQPSPAPPAVRQSGIPLVKVAGLLLLLVGLGTVLYFLMFYDTSVNVLSATVMGQDFGGVRVPSVERVQNRQNGVIVGSVMAAAGLACLLIGLSAGRGATTTRSIAVELPSGRTVIYLLVAIGALRVLGLIVHQYASASQKLSQQNEPMR